MENINLKLNYTKPRKESGNQQSWVRKYYTLKYSQKNAGFSLMEVMVVVVMIGILSAIAAPSWLSFINRQNVNKANDVLVAALQDAQRQAKKTKLSYNVSFRTNSNTSQFVVYPGVVPTTSSAWQALNWQSVGGDLEIKSKKILLGANLSAVNTASTSVSYSLTTPVTITYDYMGTLPSANFGTIPTGQTEAPGLKIVVAVPQPGSTTQATGLKRCVIVKTLLGAMQTAKDNQCS